MYVRTRFKFSARVVYTFGYQSRFIVNAPSRPPTNFYKQITATKLELELSGNYLKYEFPSCSLQPTSRSESKNLGSRLH